MRHDRLRKPSRFGSVCRTYLSHHFYYAYGEHHEDLFTVLEEPAPIHGKRVCRAEPRKFGKTTVISLALPLWHLARRTKKFILLVGESSATADANLASLVHELENNTKLLNDFPHLVPHRDSKNQITKWTDSAIMLQDGSMVVAKGMSSRMRGMKQQQYRPDLGIVDDPESPETVGSFLVRERHKRWFGGTFLGIGGDAWDVYVIGNLVHHDGLLASLLKSPEWNSKLYRAVNVPRREEERYPIVKTILVNIFGGILGCDVFARGFIQGVRVAGADLPMVVRLVGTNQAEGRKVLAESGLQFIVEDDLEAAAKRALAIAAGGN